MGTVPNTSDRTLVPPVDWLTVLGAATTDEANDTERSYRSGSDVQRMMMDKARHACCPACLVAVAQRLAALDDALQPVSS